MIVVGDEGDSRPVNYEFDAQAFSDGLKRAANALRQVIKIENTLSKPNQGETMTDAAKKTPAKKAPAKKAAPAKKTAAKKAPAKKAAAKKAPAKKAAAKKSSPRRAPRGVAASTVTEKMHNDRRHLVEVRLSDAEYRALNELIAHMPGYSEADYFRFKTLNVNV